MPSDLARFKGSETKGEGEGQSDRNIRCKNASVQSESSTTTFKAIPAFKYLPYEGSNLDHETSSRGEHSEIEMESVVRIKSIHYMTCEKGMGLNTSLLYVEYQFKGEKNKHWFHFEDIKNAPGTHQAIRKFAPR
jgi:hypothetical protein